MGVHSGSFGFKVHYEPYVPRIYVGKKLFL